jgi:clan AA aspartic protease
MTGKVNARLEAVLHLKVFGPRNTSRSVAAIVDTGFSNSLTLPPSLIKSLGLKPIAQTNGVLADGSVVTFKMYEGFLALNRRRIGIEIVEADSDPLVGMSLLDGQKLEIEVTPGGKVGVKPL